MYSGLLLVDKPQGVTSHDVVGFLRRLLGQKAVGHAGTLDPMATGLMLILLGEATKLSAFLMGLSKSYNFTVELGRSTNTWDADGTIEHTADQIFDLKAYDFDAIISRLEARDQYPIPAFAAAKRGGEALYKKARRGELVATEFKTMNFRDIVIQSRDSNSVSGSVSCSAGSYIRSLAHCLGQELNIPAHLSKLRRTRIGRFDLADALLLRAQDRNIDLVSRAGDHAADLRLSPAFLPVEQVLSDWDLLRVGGRDRIMLRNGLISQNLEKRLVPLKRRAFLSLKPVGVRVIDSESGGLLSLITAEKGAGLRIRSQFMLTKSS